MFNFRQASYTPLLQVCIYEHLNMSLVLSQCLVLADEQSFSTELLADACTIQLPRVNADLTRLVLIFMDPS